MSSETIRTAYDNQTQELILTRMLGEVDPAVDKRVGSIVRDMLAPASLELAFVYMELANLLDFGFADSTYGTLLERRVGEVGITRIPAETATGSVVFSGTAGTLIPSATEVATAGDDPLYFLTDADATIGADGTVSVAVTASAGGAASNVAIGLIAVVIGALTDVVSVTNPAAFTGGADEETDDALLARYQTRMTTPPTSGNAFQYKLWALSIAGVGDAKVYPLKRGNGTVDVVLLDAAKTGADAALVTDVSDYIQSVRPIGADVLVRSAPEIPINLSLSITLEATATIEQAVADLSAAVTEYLASLAFVDTIVRYTQIGTLILNCPSILDYSGLTVNGGTDNIAIADGDVAVLGTVTVV